MSEFPALLKRDGSKSLPSLFLKQRKSESLFRSSLFSRVIFKRRKKRKFNFVIFNLLFPFLGPKQMSELLFIALLVLCKRGNSSHRSVANKKGVIQNKKPKSKIPTLVKRDQSHRQKSGFERTGLGQKLYY